MNEEEEAREAKRARIAECSRTYRARKSQGLKDYRLYQISVIEFLEARRILQPGFEHSHDEVQRALHRLFEDK
jgi:hypothetical protein